MRKSIKISPPGLLDEAATKARVTPRSAPWLASRSERASKKASKRALSDWCKDNGWKVVFFEGTASHPRTGIVDAVMTRIKPSNQDLVEIQLVQLKSGLGGLTGAEIRRLKNAVSSLSKNWVLAAFDGETLHLAQPVPERKKRHV